MEYIFYIIIITFIYFNYKIIFSSIKNKIVPNKYLLYLILLIPIWIFFLYLFPSTIPTYHLLEMSFNFKILFHFILTFIISLTLYSLWLWSAWDTKYLLILGLFIPYIGIITFIWNIALLTLVFILWYFVWFYFWKCIFNHTYGKSLILNIKNDLKNKWEIYKKNKWWNDIYIILKWIIVFFLIFLSFRLIRFYTLNGIYSKYITQYSIIENISPEYYFYIIIWLISIIFLLIFLFRLLLWKLHLIINKHPKINKKKAWNLILIISFLWLLSFIIYEYFKNPIEISNLLYKIFTLYLFLYLAIKIIIYSYKITFWLNEVEYVNINKLKKWDIIDKKYIITMFWDQAVLGDKKYLYNIKNPLWSKEITYIKNLYKKVNKYHKKHNKLYKENLDIKTLKIFSFSIYILVWFLLSFFLWNEIIRYIVVSIISIFNKLFS